MECQFTRLVLMKLKILDDHLHAREQRLLPFVNTNEQLMWVFQKQKKSRDTVALNITDISIEYLP